MNLYIGENIKLLRLERGITQETLAEYMHVSCPAVSKWERNETLPDITMVIPLASYFGVSTDELLGLDAAKNEEKIQAYIDEYYHLGAIGKEFEKFDLITKAYKEFPNDFRIIEKYIWMLFYDPNQISDDGYYIRDKVHKDELYHLCDRVLNECTMDSVRYSALSILGGLYRTDEKIDKAIETANRFPPYFLSNGEELEGCYSYGTEEWWEQVRNNIKEITEILQVKIRKAALWHNPEEPLEQVRLLKKAVALIELIYDDGDYGFSYYDLSELYLWIAKRSVRANDFDTAFEYYEKGMAHAKMYDELPKLTTHTSFLVKGCVQDMTKISSDTEKNEVARALDNMNFPEDVYNKVKDNPKFQAIIKKYKPFAGKKKDYSLE